MKCFFISLLFLARLSAAEFHAILVCDTLGKNIELQVANDLKLMRAEVEQIARQCGLGLDLIVLEGAGLHPKKLLAAVKGCKVGPEDLFLFYFSGHGYRTAKKGTTIWPNLFCTASLAGLGFERVIAEVRKKQPRFFFGMVDCCNHVMPEWGAPPTYEKSLGGKKGRRELNYQQLFCSYSGEVLTTSSEPGEYSWCIPSGALYTKAVWKHLRAECMKKGSPNWQALLDRAAIEVRKYQHPIALVDLR